jgi:glyoxylase-like metal-dependent hydrolase (beta-lactamase superfamily II)
MKNNFLKLGLAAILLTAVTTNLLTTAQQRTTFTPEQVERLKIRQVPGKEGLYLLPGFDGNMSGGNIAVRVTDDGVIIVDNKYSYSYENITRQVATITSQPVRYVFNTHHHFDHAGSNAFFMPDAKVIGHENVRVNMLRNAGSSAPSDGAPRLTYSDKASVYLGNAEVEAYYLGCGHTNGDSVILFPDLRTIHTGDLFIWGDRLDGSTMAPFIDYANGGCAGDWVATLDRILDLDFDTVIPGHGPLLSKVEIRIFRDKFEQMLSRMRSLMSSGINRYDVVTQLDILDLNWPLSPDGIQAIYDELSQ